MNNEASERINGNEHGEDPSFNDLEKSSSTALNSVDMAATLVSEKPLNSFEEKQDQEQNVLQSNSTLDSETEDTPTYTLEKFMAGACCFSCPLCSYETHALNTFWDHALEQHNLKPEALKENHGKSFQKQVKKIECAVCFKHVLHEPHTLGKHCVSAHGKTMEKFYSEHLSNDEPMDDIERQEEEKPSDAAFDSALIEKTKQNFEKWWDSFAKYLCAVCGTQFRSVNSLSLHIKKHDNMNLVYYVQRYGKLPGPKGTFHCRECKKNIMPDRPYVSRHLKIHHTLTPQEYHMCHLNMENLGMSPTFQKWQNGCEFKCRICNKDCGEYGILANHIKRGHNGLSVESYEELHGKMMTKEVKKKCIMCGSQVLWAPFQIKKHLSSCHNMSMAKYFASFVAESGFWCVASKQKEKTNNKSSDNFLTEENKHDFQKWWDSFTKYPCAVCGKEFLSANSHAVHIKTHIMSMESYIQMYGKMPKGTFRCHKCKKKIRSDRPYVTRHLRICQNLTPQEYYNRFLYMKNPSEQEPIKSIQHKPPKSIKQQPHKSIEPPLARSDLNMTNDFQRRQGGGFNGKISPSFDMKLFRAWSDRCLYNCHLCNRVFSDRIILKSHLRLTHKVNVKANSILPSSIVKGECPASSECKDQVEFNRSSLNEHVTLKHGYYLRDFYIKYVLKEKSVPAGPLHEWASQCRYQCRICSRNYYTRGGLEEHLVKQHNSNAKEYVLKLGPMKTKHVKKMCPVPGCQKLINMERGDLTIHAEEHNMTLFNFYDKSMSNGQLDEQSPSIPFPGPSNSPLPMPITNNTILVEQGQYSIASIPHQQGSREFRFQWSQGSHCCLLCQLSMDQQLVREHLEAVHNMSLSDYEDQFEAELKYMLGSSVVDSAALWGEPNFNNLQPDVMIDQEQYTGQGYGEDDINIVDDLKVEATFEN